VDNQADATPASRTSLIIIDIVFVVFFLIFMRVSTPPVPGIVLACL